MIGVQIVVNRTKSLMRRAAILVAATQVMLGSAPLFESGVRNASSHVEANGVQLHYAHDEATCVACNATRILGGAEPTPPAVVCPPTRLSSPTPELFQSALPSGRDHNNSRAPPQDALA
jgi:hypothetical protein